MEEDLAHKDHELSTTIEYHSSGRFLDMYCNDCQIRLGSLNVNYILNKIE